MRPILPPNGGSRLGDNRIVVSDLTISAGDRSLSGLWSPARSPVAVGVIAHGAGAGMDHPFMAGVAEGMAADGTSVLRFNFPYAQDGRRSPDRPPALIGAWRSALAEAGRRAEGLPVVAGGKSLGGRMASMLAAEEGRQFAGSALVLLGYPLHAPGRSEQVRDAHLPDVKVPILFIQGTADALARFELMEALVKRLGSRARLHAVQGGDHSFRVRGPRRPDVEIGAELGAVAAGFVREVVA
jgi:predicted alpha/beta-hydrolase family hydrolase